MRDWKVLSEKLRQHQRWRFSLANFLCHLHMTENCIQSNLTKVTYWLPYAGKAPVVSPRSVSAIPIGWLHFHHSWDDSWKLPAHIITALCWGKKRNCFPGAPTQGSELSLSGPIWHDLGQMLISESLNGASMMDLPSAQLSTCDPPGSWWSHCTGSIWAETSKAGERNVWQHKEWSLSAQNPRPQMGSFFQRTVLGRMLKSHLEQWFSSFRVCVC